MRYLSCFLFISSITFSSHVFAQTDISRVLINCTLNVSGERFNEDVTAIDNLTNDIYLGHTDDPNGLQDVFTIAETHPELNNMGRAAVYGRAYRIDDNTSGVLIGFFKAQIRFGNSLTEGVIQHEALSSWQFTPIYVFEYELDHQTGALSPIERVEYTAYGDFVHQPIKASYNTASKMDLSLRDSEATRFTGLTYLSEVDLHCSGYPVQ